MARQQQSFRVARESISRSTVDWLLATLWFGLLTGALEIVLVLVLNVVYPNITMETIRTNRHYLWMIPVSNLLVFAAVAPVVTGLSLIRLRPAGWLARRIPPALAALGLLLNLRSLYLVAVVLLACGLATQVGAWIDRRPEKFARLVRLSLPAMAAILLVFAGLDAYLVETSEQRAIAHEPPAKPKAPNVLVIVLDAVRAGCLSLYGHDRPTTPNLQRLASRAVVYAEARSTAPWTAPTHASLFTGRWPHELSISMSNPLDGSFPTLAEVLGQNGYATGAFIGNFYYCNTRYGLDRGFARFEEAYENRKISLFETAWASSLGKNLLRSLGYSTQLEDGVSLVRKTAAMVNDDFLGWLSKRDDDGRPFFAFLNYYDAHRPYIFPDPTIPRFGASALPVDQRIEVEREFMELMAGQPAPPGMTPQQVVAQLCMLSHDSYDSCIAYMDRQIGLLVDELGRRGLLENTYVIVTSDHGEQFGEHGTVSHGTSLHRPEVHIPLVVIPPSGLSSTVVVREPVSIRELPATIAGWAGLGAHHPFPGASLARFLDPNQTPARLALAGSSPVLCEHRENIAFRDPTRIPPNCGPANSLVSPQGIYIRRDDGHEALYDLTNDPREQNNLAQDPQSRPVIERFRAEMLRVRGDLTAEPTPGANLADSPGEHGTFAAFLGLIPPMNPARNSQASADRR